MRKENIKVALAYILKYAFWSFIAMPYFEKIFVSMPGLDYNTSKLILILILTAGAVPGLVYTLRRGFYDIAFIAGIINSFGVYTLIICVFFDREIFMSIIIQLITIVLAFSYLVFSDITEDDEDKKTVFKRRFKKLIKSLYVITALCFVLNIAVLGITLGKNGPIIKAPVDALSLKTDEALSIANNREALLDFKADRWEKLTIKERLEVLRLVIKIESEHLGIGYVPSFTLEDLEGNQAGVFTSGEKIIKLDTEHFEKASPEAVLKSLLHECRHSYQHECVDIAQEINEKYKKLFIYRQLAGYQYGFDNYETVDYKTNPVEVDAREYADRRIVKYLEEIYGG